MIRRPPRSTLFPTRRSSDLFRVTTAAAPTGTATVTLDPAPADGRSEEHTSELQSRLHLVCRLLLEKKRIQSRFSHIANTTILHTTIHRGLLDDSSSARVLVC